jgi:hypothetical protein
MRRVDQDMAAEAARLLPPTVSSQLRTRYRTLRVMCHTSGLAATYAYVASKAGSGPGLERAYEDVRVGLGRHLCSAGTLPDVDPQDARQVLTELAKLSAAEYLRASAQVTALLGWLARLADAVVDRGRATAPGGHEADG